MALRVGELLLTGFEREMVGSVDETPPHGLTPLRIGARVDECVAHRGKLIEDEAPRVFVLRGREVAIGVGAREHDQLRAHGATWRRGIRIALAGRYENKRE